MHLRERLTTRTPDPQASSRSFLCIGFDETRDSKSSRRKEEARARWPRVRQHLGEIRESLRFGVARRRSEIVSTEELWQAISEFEVLFEETKAQNGDDNIQETSKVRNESLESGVEGEI